MLAGLAAVCLCLGLRAPSAVRRHLDLLAPRTRERSPWRRVMSDRELRHADARLTSEQLVAAKVMGASCGVLLMATLGLFVSIGPLVVAAAGYLGWICPSLVVASRARRARSDADRATIVLVERLDALVAAGRPPETALAGTLVRRTGSALLDETLHCVHDAYLLGAPLFATLAHHAREEGLEACAALADDLERARDLGAASTAILRERRSSLRALERVRSLEAASRVEGKLMLVLALCYLPALMLLVVIPLFMSLLDGLGT